MNEFDLTGRRALVTGSTEGIGRAIAYRLASAGADVILHGIAIDKGSATLLEEMVAEGLRVRLVPADFTDPGAIASLAATAGPIDILVSNVAVQVRQPLGAIDDPAIELQVAVNLKSALRLIQATLPHMVAQRWGRIVAIGSVQESVPHPDMIIYAALKAAQANMVRNIARQVAGQGVTVNAIAPGVIRTGRNTAALADADYAARVLGSIPAGQWGEPDDIAGAALLLCSEAGRYITGASIPVDGGMHL